MIRSKIFNFHSVGSVIIAKLKIKSSQKWKCVNKKQILFHTEKSLISTNPLIGKHYYMSITTHAYEKLHVYNNSCL